MQCLEIKEISKSYHKKQALCAVSAMIRPGITALLGPNGAGKSTLLHIISTLLPPTSGEVLYGGQNISALKDTYLAKLSVQFQNQPMYKNYTAEEYLVFCSALKGLPKETAAAQGQQLLEYFGMADSRKKKIGTCSGGMRQRLALCGTFLGSPEIILLDEPSAGLDIYEREALKSYLCSLKEKAIVLVSTHIVSDIENIADQILLLNAGQIHAHGTQAELIRQVEGHIWALPEDADPPIGLPIYHTDGKRLCFSAEQPAGGAIRKQADLTDVYFSCVAVR